MCPAAGLLEMRGEVESKNAQSKAMKIQPYLK